MEELRDVQAGRRGRQRVYRYITFAQVDLGLLVRILMDERYLVPSRVRPGEHGNGVSLAYRRGGVEDVTGVLQGVVSGSPHHLDQLAEDAADVFAMAPLWRGRWRCAADVRAVAGPGAAGVAGRFCRGRSSRVLCDAILDQASPGARGAGQILEQAALIERARAAHQTLLDLDELAMRCLGEPGEHTEAELAGLRAQRQDISQTILALRLDYATVYGPVTDAWPL